MIHWCLVSVVCVAVIAVVIRYLVGKLTSSPHSLISTLADEFVGNFCSGVIVMELGVIASMYGAYSIPLLLSGFIHLVFKYTYFMTYDLYASPLTFIGMFYQNRRVFSFSLFFVCAIITIQIMGVLAGQSFAKSIWTFEDDFHVNALGHPCASAISSNHPWVYAAFAEGFGVFIATAIDFFLPRRISPFVNSVVVMGLYYVFNHISGAFLNPSVAFALSFRCQGHQSDIQYFMIYVVSPIIGSIAAFEFVFRINRWMTRKNANKTE